MTKIECSSCRKSVETNQCYELYVGLGNCQVVCINCQQKPFKDVMLSLDSNKSKIYTSGTCQENPMW